MDNIFNKKEYLRFKKQYELLGEIEEKRKRKSAKDKSSIHQLLLFLDEINELSNSKNNISQSDDYKLNLKIDMIRIINNAFKQG